MRGTDSIREAIGLSLQELSRAAEDRTAWMSVFHRVARGQSQLEGVLHTRTEAPSGETFLITN